jgi:hypothetical protein
MANQLTPFTPYGSKQAYLTWEDETGATQTFVFDNVLTEEWSTEADATSHPVETGADVTDHVRVKTPTVTLTVHSTREPLDANNFQDATKASLTLPQTIWGPNRRVGVTARELDYSVWQNNIATNAAINAIGVFIGEAIGDRVGQNPTGTKPGDVLGRTLAKALQGAQDANAFLAALGVAVQQLNVTQQLGFPVRTLGDIVAVGIEAAFGALNLPPVAIPTATLAPIGLGSAPDSTSAIATTLQWPDGFDFVTETISTLLGLMTAVQSFTVQGSKRKNVSNMVLLGVSETRNSDEGTGATITIKMQQIRVVATQVVSAPIPSLPRATPPVNKGAQNPEDASNDDQETVARALGGLAKSGIGGLLKKFSGGS